MRRPGPVGVAERERNRHPHDGHRERRSPGPEHLAEIGLEPDLEEQEQHAELGQHVHHLARQPLDRHDTQRAGPKHHAGDELAEHGGLAHAFGQLAQQLGGDQDGGESQEEPRDVHPALDGDGQHARTARWRTV